MLCCFSTWEKYHLVWKILACFPLRLLRGSFSEMASSSSRNEELAPWSIVFPSNSSFSCTILSMEAAWIFPKYITKNLWYCVMIDLYIWYQSSALAQVTLPPLTTTCQHETAAADMKNISPQIWENLSFRWQISLSEVVIATFVTSFERQQQTRKQIERKELLNWKGRNYFLFKRYPTE